MQQQHQGQESLFVVAEQTGQMRVRDFSDSHEHDGAFIDRVEQKIHLINTLGYLASARSREGLVKTGPEGVTDRYGERASTVVLGAERKRVEFINKAKASFERAVGMHELIDAGIEGKSYSSVQIRRDTRQMYSDFLKKYWLPGKEKANSDYRKRLEKEIAELSGDTEVIVSMKNRFLGLRPHADKPMPETEKTTEDVEEKLDEIGTRERLEAIQKDPRAGFLPKTRNSKDRVMSWLDYLDDPDKPLGIIHQLREVFVRAQNPTRKSSRPNNYLGVKHGVRAIESLAWEVGDDLLEANKRLMAVQALKSKAGEDQRPDLSLHEAFSLQEYDNISSLQELYGEHLLGLAAFVQFRDLTEYVQTGMVQGLEESPLKTSEDPPRSQRPKFDAAAGKRKTVLNQYTRPDVDSDFRQHIVARLKALSIKDVRQNIDACVEDLEKEVSFTQRRFSELAEFKSGPYQPIQDAISEISHQLNTRNAVA